MNLKSRLVSVFLLVLIALAISALIGFCIFTAHAQSVKNDSWKTSLMPVLKSITKASKVYPYSLVDFGREKNLDCISVVLDNAQLPNSRVILMKLRGSIPKGYVCFVGTTHWCGDFKPNGFEVVIGPGRSQFDIIKHAKTDGVNCDISTEDIILKLKSFDKEVGINILQASTDYVEFEFVKQPEDLLAFTRKVCSFCPDLINQGTGRAEDVMTWIKNNKKVYLWWD